MNNSMNIPDDRYVRLAIADLSTFRRGVVSDYIDNLRKLIEQHEKALCLASEVIIVKNTHIEILKDFVEKQDEKLQTLCDQISTLLNEPRD